MKTISYAAAIRPAERSIPAIRRSMERVALQLQAASEQEGYTVCIDLLDRLTGLAALLERKRKAARPPPQTCRNCGKAINGPAYHRHIKVCGRTLP